jgi:hypothetical protein
MAGQIPEISWQQCGWTASRQNIACFQTSAMSAGLPWPMKEGRHQANLIMHKLLWQQPAFNVHCLYLVWTLCSSSCSRFQLQFAMLGDEITLQKTTKW